MSKNLGKYDKSATPTEELYIALDDLDFAFYKQEVNLAIAGWLKGLDAWEIAKHLKRDPDEAVILLMDLARKRKIPAREMGMFGGRIRHGSK